MNALNYIKKMSVIPNARDRLILSEDVKKFLMSFDGEGKELTDNDIDKINMIKTVIYNPNYPLKA